jgi:hypothetical protein
MGGNALIGCMAETPLLAQALQRPCRAVTLNLLYNFNGNVAEAGRICRAATFDAP